LQKLFIKSSSLCVQLESVATFATGLTTSLSGNDPLPSTQCCWSYGKKSPGLSGRKYLHFIYY